LKFFDTPLAAGAVGSFPHLDPVQACKIILDNFPEIPTWPQLPRISLLEQMEIQYSQGLPCVVIDREKERMYFDTSGDNTAELEKFYESIINDNVDYFAITREYSRGIYTLKEALSKMDLTAIKYIKTQVTGPVSFALTITDENKRALYYNELFRDVIVKGLAMKARWQMRKFAGFGKRIICIIDEPILSAFGSSTYVSVLRQDVVALISEMVDAIHSEGGIAGIHCCGNTEWTIPIDAGVDIINFDAFEYGYSIELYPQEIKEFLMNGGVLSWGIVPTSMKVDHYTSASLMFIFEQFVDNLEAKGIDRKLLLRNSLLTASCGTGSVPIDRAERIAQLTRKVTGRIREKYAEYLS